MKYDNILEEVIMNSIYKNPYKTKYKLEIINKINRDGITYGKLENPPFFVGMREL